MSKRIILVITDSLGVGAMPDSELYGDRGVNTLRSIVLGNTNINLSNMKNLGLANIEIVDYMDKVDAPIGNFGYMQEVSNGKDTSTGHWEIAGLKIDVPFKSFPEGFPDEVIEPFKEKIGKDIIWNKPASGTEILERFGEEHMKTGNPIIYTSADSVFQIAAHEEVIPIDELYKMCEIAREILSGDYQVARVIARPFVGTPGNFARTSNRRDYSIDPYSDTMLDIVKARGLDVLAVGKIVDIFNGKGVTYDVHTHDNMDGVDHTIRLINEENNGIIFTNLVDFDAKFGHRRDIKGYGDALEEFDARIPEILEAMKEDDILMITADHGNDPGYDGTDHTREYVPLLVYGKGCKSGVDLGCRKTFADISATVLEFFEIEERLHGESFLNSIIK